MPVANPSPPQDASSSARGLVNTIAQSFQGVKTFLATLIASAGIQVGLLFNTNGTGASDVAVKVGTAVANASVNTAAKLLSVRAGLNGGTEVEKLFVADRGMYLENILEIGGRSGSAFMDQNVVLTMNSAVKTWLFNGYNTGGHIVSLTRLGRYALNGAVASNAQGATAIFRAVDNTEPTMQVEGLSGQAVIQRWRDSTPTVVSSIMANGEFEHAVAGSGIVLRSPDGSRWRLTVSNAGALVIAAA